MLREVEQPLVVFALPFVVDVPYLAAVEDLLYESDELELEVLIPRRLAVVLASRDHIVRVLLLILPISEAVVELMRLPSVHE